MPIDNSNRLQIASTAQQADFATHLFEEFNDRIIFSGAFGIGKTTFLRDFFNKQAAVSVYLSPVNYSISSNEDIFQLIKYDLLFELLINHRLELHYSTISRYVAYGVKLQDKTYDIFKGLLKWLPTLNKQVPDLETAISSIDKITEFIKETEQQRQDPELNGRIAEFVTSTGKMAALELDFISTFIEQGLEQLANQEGQTLPKVLIVDDLDRIDPEHAFRLFNIFSAHFDYNKTSSNKFGFDKIIFVCDINNIRNIFHSRYGTSTDFTGYIDKFYSKEIYYFNNAAEVANACELIINSFKVEEKYKEFLTKALFNTQRHETVLMVLLKEMIYAGALNLRRLVSVYGTTYRFQSRDLGLLRSRREIPNWQISGVLALEVLYWVLGGAEALDKALQRLLLYGKSKSYFERAIREENYLVGEFLPLLDYAQHQFSFHQQNTGETKPPYVFTNPTNGDRIAYRLLRWGGMRDEYFAEIVAVNDAPYREQDLHLLDIVYQAFTMLRKRGFFR